MRIANCRRKKFQEADTSLFSGCRHQRWWTDSLLQNERIHFGAACSHAPSASLTQNWRRSRRTLLPSPNIEPQPASKEIDSCSCRSKSPTSGVMRRWHRSEMQAATSSTVPWRYSSISITAMTLYEFHQAPGCLLECVHRTLCGHTLFGGFSNAAERAELQSTQIPPPELRVAVARVFHRKPADL
ncbi:hypothetical protein NOV72_01566 [Caballeronia novacaledonica]|uniref:Uncharacterized protein n=1 Tax=Caballeronia novacaledonica TaxID=1544861 RepID=A0A2U3I2G5_9BURK|nr:hypothetical protein NOV72_01566 [Caballeronia novacaledonica]